MLEAGNRLCVEMTIFKINSFFEVLTDSVSFCRGQKQRHYLLISFCKLVGWGASHACFLLTTTVDRGRKKTNGVHGGLIFLWNRSKLKGEKGGRDRSSKA